jgi:hypothetical protein
MRMMSGIATRPDRPSLSASIRAVDRSEIGAVLTDSIWHRRHRRLPCCHVVVTDITTDAVWRVCVMPLSKTVVPHACHRA